MGKKKKKKQKRKQSGTKPEISIQHDPYWKVSSIYMDPQRLGRYFNKFGRFEDEYPWWTEELLDGTPTFYCILGVARGATGDELEEAYGKKNRLSHYHDDLIEEAYDTLSDPDLQKEYDELLTTFTHITKCMPPAEKDEIRQIHDACMQAEINFDRMRDIMNAHDGFLDFHIYGMPDLYELIELTRDSSPDDIKETCRTGSELFKQVYTILGDPDVRSDYDFFIDFNRDNGNRVVQDHLKTRRKMWDKLDDDVFEKMALSVLTDHGEIKESIYRQSEIMNHNQDWERYLPPSEDTFFSILGLDRSLLSGDKKEVEKAIREKYRYLEKTPQVNLAYSMLKNASQRDDYLWLIDNNEMLNSFTKLLFTDDEDDAPSPKIQGMKKGSKSKQSFDQLTFDDILKMIEDEIG